MRIEQSNGSRSESGCLRRKGRALLVAFMLTAGSGLAQGLGDMVFTAGTVAQDQHGRDVAFLSWMATDSSMLLGAQYDVYRKNGGIDSTQPFAIAGSALLQTDPRTIGLMIRRGAELGGDLVSLENTVDQLFAEAIPDGALPLEDKLAGIIIGSLGDSVLYDNLVFLARANPGLALAIGRGLVCRIPAGRSTFEIRDHYSDEVIGRLTLEAGNREVLPAPDNLVQVFETSPMGHLNVRLRWEEPDALKRVSLLQFGYHVYRMPRAFAEQAGRNYHLSPPSPEVLLALVGTDPDVVQVNTLPVLIDDENVTADTYFVIDDNEGLSGGTPLVDGDEYYYFVTALDLLGRDGEVSRGLLAQVCDRVAPSAPSSVRTRTLYQTGGGAPLHAVEVSWDHSTNRVDVAQYYVYRHLSVSNLQAMAVHTTSNRISGAIAPVATSGRMRFVDNTLDTNDFGRTYWYTVRAEDNGSCGPNLSGSSGPAFGLVRDREGPPPSTNASVWIQVEDLDVEFHSAQALHAGPVSNFWIRCERHPSDGPITWAEFSYYQDSYQGAGSETNAIPLGRFYYPDAHAEVSTSLYLGKGVSDEVTLFCRVGSDNGRVSEVAFRSLGIPDGEDVKLWNVLFKGYAQFLTGPAVDPDESHLPGINRIPPEIRVEAPPGSESYRFYRRLDGGPRVLIAEGLILEGAMAIAQDFNGLALNGGELCYYYQFLDEHGNAGAITLIFCFPLGASQPLPTPVLAPIVPRGTEHHNSGMDLTWFCPPPGVERFELAVAREDESLPGIFSDSVRELSGNPAGNLHDVLVGGVTNTYRFGFYRTGRVGANFGTPDMPQFALDAPADLNATYVIMLRAIGAGGEEGPWSNAEPFRWSVVPDTGPQVPWPARNLPPVQQREFHPKLIAEFLDPNTHEGIFESGRVGIRIGEFPNNSVSELSKDRIQLEVLYEPMSFLYPNALFPDKHVMPCVLYRYQMPNDLYPKVGGDVAQVSVLMEEMAYGNHEGRTAIYDPFVVAARPLDTSDSFGLYLLDTQPVVRGVKYQYLLLRFTPDHELDRIIPVGPVEIPLEDE